MNVPPNGYAWWYVDGISHDGSQGISVIGFIGSVFSPWYAWSGRRAPDNHVCINVGTYGKGGRFTMTDRGSSALRTSSTCLSVGPSSMKWTGSSLVIDLNEISSLPLVSRIRGQVRLHPSAITRVEMALTSDGAHAWRPFAPICDIEVELEGSRGNWRGHGYFDANFGTRALEADFDYWTWGRYPTKSGATVFYDADRCDGSELARAISFCPDGEARITDAPPKTRFRRSLWQLRRETRADPGVQPRQSLNMLDAPFYSRSVVNTRLHGEAVCGVHEALDLRRFRLALLKPMLAVRAPRRARWVWPEEPN